MVGMGALRKIDGNTAEIKRMRVEIKLQRQGIGLLILNYLIGRAKELGYTRIVLDTSTNQIAAMRLYEKSGFKEYQRGEIAHLHMIYYEMILPI